jgi:hypothetical protein
VVVNPRRTFVLALLIASLLPGMALVQAADNPTVGLLAGHNQLTPEVVVPAGTTKIGTLNSNGEAVFNLVNTSGKPIAGFVVAIDAGAAVKPLGYACSTFNALLKTCTVDVAGNVITLTFTGTPDIKPDAKFRLGFAPGIIAGPWPAGATVTVTVK